MAALADRLVSDVGDVSAEDKSRADVYALLGSLISAPPGTEHLKQISRMTGPVGAFGSAVTSLAKIAGATSAPSVRYEYQELLIGLGRGEVVPYASYYLTGFLQEKPLAQLRRDMARLGITRSRETSDPEDHAASVSEMMAGLIVGRFGEPAPLDVQYEFYSRHIASWMPVLFRDLEAAKTSVFYATVGSVGRAFLDIESSAFEMV